MIDSKNLPDIEKKIYNAELELLQLRRNIEELQKRYNLVVGHLIRLYEAVRQTKGIETPEGKIPIEVPNGYIGKRYKRIGKETKNE